MENSTELVANCSTDYYNEKRFVNVAITAATSAGVSLLACLFAVFIIVLFKKWQSFGQRLIAYLLFSATLFSFATVLRRVDFDREFTAADERFCTFSAFATQACIWLVIDSIVAITLYLFLRLVWNKLTEKYEFLYIIFIFAFPSTFCWIPFIRHTFGRSGAWCWIRIIDFNTCERIVLGQVLQLVEFYVPLLIILPTIITVYLVMLCTLRRNRNRWKGINNESYKHTNKILKSETLYLLVYPLIFFVLTVPILVTRIQNWVDPRNPVPALWHISAISINLIGATISLASILDKDTRRRLRWSHIRAALKNYRNTQGVSEYKTGDLDDSDEHKVSYKQMTDESYSDETSITTLEPL